MSNDNFKRAIPRYAESWGIDSLDIPPGHRFFIYDNQFNGFDEKNNVKSDGELQRYVTKRSSSTSKLAAMLFSNLEDRADATLGELAVERTLSLAVKTASALLVGLGIEHITDNGFSFTVPHGLPYLPGSSIKGVLRDVAGEVLTSTESFISEDDLVAFFGREVGEPEPNNLNDSGAMRGHLTFWDLIVEPIMKVDGLTAHNSSYLMGSGLPVENESPNPVAFLAVASGAKATFRITASNSLSKMDPKWQEKLTHLLKLAFDYGFGAKTTVGYGRFTTDVQRQQKVDSLRSKKQEALKAAALQREEEDRLAQLAPIDAKWEIFVAESRRKDQSIKVLGLVKKALTSEHFAGLEGDLGPKLREQLIASKAWLEIAPSGKVNPKKRKQLDITAEVKKFIDEHPKE